MLKLTNISKSYPQRGMVLNGLNLEVKAGETLAITGPSGSGKTTLLNIIGLLDNSDSGSIEFNGTEIGKLNAEESARHRRDNIGFVFQDHLLLPHLNIRENIFLPIMARKASKETLELARHHIDLLLQRIGITGIAASYPHEISGGEAQRATLVRALANNPSLLLADEPTGSLDSENGALLSSLLKDINSQYNTSIIAVTHSEKFASKLSNVFRLDKGILHPKENNSQ